MSANKNLLFALVAGLAFLQTPAARAAEAAPFWVTNAAPRLQARIVREGGPGLRTVNRAYINRATNRFALIVPDGYRVDYSDPQRISLVSTDYNSIITFFVNDYFPATGDADDSYRQFLLTKYPKAFVGRQFSLAAGDTSGPAFDLQWKSEGGMPRRGWFGFMPARAGVLQFELISSPQKFETVRSDFEFVLATFRQSDANGKLNVPLMSDKL